MRSLEERERSEEAKRGELRRLAELVHDLTAHGPQAGPPAALLDSPASPVLTSAAVHEWFGPDEAEPGAPWLPPLCLLAHAAGRAAARGGWVLWVGRSVWARPWVLCGGDGASLLGRSMFIDAPTLADRVWAVDLLLRCPAVAAVVADGSGLKMPHTRRLQLAAQSGRAMALLARPARELKELSAAATRWLVRPCPSPTDSPRWIVELLRCKGVQPAPEDPRSWSVEWDHERRALAVPADVVGGPGQEVAGLHARSA